ncbi:MAG: Crp/Fnr family transcriptional regulator [Brevundimonas sp.]
MENIHQENLWLSRLSQEDRSAISEHLWPKDLSSGQILFDQGEWLSTIYFVDEGIISSVIPLSDGRSVEAYMVGNEGMTGTEASFLPARSINRLLVQSAGRARGIETSKFQQIVAASPTIRQALADYQWGLKAELEQTTACNAVHTAEPRFAKWLLRCHDRTEGDVLHLTQEFLAQMLGTQRSTVNDAAQSLQTKGAIRYMRGKITVGDRAALEAAACECYSPVMATRDARSVPMADENHRRAS